MLESKNLEELQTLQNQGKLDEGLALVEKLFPEANEDPILWEFMGIFLAAKNCLFGAIAAFYRAMELPNPPTSAYSNLANVYTKLLLFSKANILHKIAIQKKPKNVVFYRNYWVTLFEERQMVKAFEIAQQALKIEPNNHFSQYMLGLWYLLEGEYKKAWPLFENRIIIESKQFTNIPALPRWKGESLKEKTLIIRSEQGYGDIILFSRFIPLIKKKNTKIIFMTSRNLLILFNHIPGVDVLIPYYNKCQFFPPADFYLNIMSLAYILKINHLKSIPPPPPLYIPKQSKDKIMTAITPYQNRFKIGICWTGDPTNLTNPLKSIAIDFFLQLTKVSGIELFNFQKGSSPIVEHSPLKCFVRNIESLFNDFADTAAAIEAMDLMITIDTSVAHLAGSLGKPTWLLLHNSSYWVWLDKRTDSPWYPSMRLYRQKTPGNWQDVFKEVIKDLATVVANKIGCGK